MPINAYYHVSNDAGIKDFPDNTASRFKFEFEEYVMTRGRRVTLGGIALPPTPRKIKLHNPFMFRFQWFELIQRDGDYYRTRNLEVASHDLENTPRNGREMMNAVRALYNQERGEGSYHGSTFLKKSTDELAYTVMRGVKDGECLLDNTRTIAHVKVNGEPRYVGVIIGIELAEKMGWVQMTDDGGYELGPI